MTILQSTWQWQVLEAVLPTASLKDCFHFSFTFFHLHTWKYSSHITTVRQQVLRQAGTWDLGASAAVLAPGQTSSPATKYKETIRG